MHRFGELEAAIMDQVWSATEPLTVRVVVDALQRDRSAAYTTVQTVMDILYRKGWLDRAKHGRAYRYSPTLSRDAYTAQLMDQALASSSDRGAALLRFVETMDSGEVDQLRDVIEQAKRHRDDTA
ncbi:MULTISPECIES: BlaI/MecI/CopY family transcriptional regulator [unclassified Saccharopolyspora]|uniref:BlaI/MecI/CopY family transcriptional regulator n=1 Tax=Saccharopolyspora TaxID=1835 RepID=UPI00190C6D8F|nr:BlaI/MecI/CopY family transcriptional regulator [Saccharopolyspora sp. HNM0986]MBK0868810.1 BlaI/MecI/CopY family transcriptional regulator [Saccharopolyspora sp. HNM0986]